MYYFPDLDEKTRQCMISELELDMKKGLFYDPLSMTSSYLLTYRRLLKECCKNGTPETLQKKLTPAFFRQKDRNGRKISANISQMVAFSDFNRYYVRALLVRAIRENKKLSVYRAKQSVNERKESCVSLNKMYSDKMLMQQMLELFRDYRRLFGLKNQPELLKPNSGLSLRFAEKALI